MMRGLEIASLLAMAEGLPKATEMPPVESMPKRPGMPRGRCGGSPRSMKESGTGQCKCGRTISANKRQCRGCAEGDDNAQR